MYGLVYETTFPDVPNGSAEALERYDAHIAQWRKNVIATAETMRKYAKEGKYDKPIVLYEKGA
jgi:hypothetical protein